MSEPTVGASLLQDIERRVQARAKDTSLDMAGAPSDALGMAQGQAPTEPSPRFAAIPA